MSSKAVRGWLLGGLYGGTVVGVLISSIVMGARLSTAAVLLVGVLAPAAVAMLIGLGAPSASATELLYAVEIDDRPR